jgi:predicted chitinase
MADINDSTKKTTKSLMGGLLSLLRGSNKDSEILGKNASDSEVLGGIYKLMVQKENLNRLDYEKRKNYAEEQDIEQARRHAEIVKALTVRRKPAPKKAKAKKPFRLPTLPGRKPVPVPAKPGAPTAPKPAPVPKPAEPAAPTAPKPSAPAPNTAAQEAARRAQEETARRAQEETARRAREEAARRAQEETARRAQEETARRAREEAVRRAQEETARRAQEETARRARESAEAARRAREAREAAEAAKRAKDAEEAARKAREAAEAAKRAKDAEEAARKAREAEESARRARESAEAARRAREAAEVARRAREANKRRDDRTTEEEKGVRAAGEAAKREADRRTREEATRKAREEADRRAREEAARKSAERVERKPDQPPTAQPAPPAPARPPAQPARPAGPSASRVPRRTLEDAKKSGVAVVAALSSVGVTNVYAQKAILQTSAKESLIDVASNEFTAADYLATLNKRGYGYIQQSFPQIQPGKRLSKALGYDNGVPEELVRKKMAEGNDAFYDFMYGGIMGNNQPGDGWKYRGRGLIAITGKSNYAKTSETLAKMGVNVDLVNNPDRLREPNIAYKAAVAYYINNLADGNVKKGLEKLNSFKTQDEALREIIHATAGKGHKIESIERGFGNNKIDEKGVATGSHLFVNYERAKGYSSLADQIISMSSENSQMRQQAAPAAGPGTTNNFNLPQPAAAGQQNRPVVDDRSPYSRKSTQ